MTPEEHASIIGDFLEFSKYMFKEVNGSEFIENWHHKIICETLEKVVIGDISRLIITMPPRHSKSELAVVNFIPWTLGLFPDSEYINCSYSATLAENNAYNAKTLVEHEAYQKIFPYVKLRNDSNARNKWATTQGGVVHSVGTMGSITGKGAGKMREGFAGCLIVDDPLKPEDANSDTIRPKINDWFTGTLESRLNKRDTPIIVIQQRLHEDDLAGYLLDGGNGEEWYHLNIPAISDEGEALWPFKLGIDDLRRMEISDPYTFAGQYMQTPTPKGGGIFKEDWIQWYMPHSLPDFKYTFITGDTAQKTKEQNDFSVLQHWGYGDDNKLYLLNMLRGKWEGPELEQQFKLFYGLCSNKHKVRACYVEDKASGTGLIQSIKRYGKIPIQAVQRNTDKVTRAYDTAPWMAQGNIVMSRDIDQIEALMNELVTFPVGKHDDTLDPMMDAVTIAYSKPKVKGAVNYG